MPLASASSLFGNQINSNTQDGCVLARPCHLQTGEEAMEAAKSELPTSDSANETTDGGIRAPVRGNRHASAAESCDAILAAGAASIVEIEHLIGELQATRDYLQSEGERVRSINARYANLTRTASASVKIISESIGKWRNNELDAAFPADARIRRSNASSIVMQIPPSASN